MNKNFPGISEEEALKKLEEYGPNELKDLHKVSPLQILLRQIKKNYILYLLLAASVISFFVGKGVTAYTILFVAFLVVSISFIQEFRAEKAIAALKKMIMPVSIVIRGGKEKEIPSENLVPGDVLVLRSGERVPADCVLLEEKGLLVNESILTGEAKEVKKEISDSIFMGSFIVDGRCLAQIVHTGMSTKFGKIASMISTAEKEMPLQDKINQISKYMVLVAISMSVLTGVLMVTRSPSLSSAELTNILILMIALAVSAFPEGLPVVLVTTLAVGASRMAKRNAIVNRMSIIETLGETTVICTDKTGTLTSGEMTVKKILVDGNLYDVEGVGFKAEGNFSLNGKDVDVEKVDSLKMLLKTAVFCNDARIERTGEDQEYQIFGSPTEASLLVLAAKANVHKEDMDLEREEEVPFNSQRKMMSVLVKDDGKHFVFAKGAVEVLLSKCSNLKESEIKQIEKVNKELTVNSFRTLALAYKEHSSKGKSYQEDDFIFLGLVAIEDPPREEVKEALVSSFGAGIAVKMITGDHKETAIAVAKQIGLFKAGLPVDRQVLEGTDLEAMSDEELSARIGDITIFARVKPEHKLRIVKVLKEKGEIVTMTGDGVNDAPALKEAHIGVAMGKNGTDVSRSVADLTLKDDNFVTIVAAIKEGRTVFNNIRKFISYQLACNYAELTVLFIGVLLAPYLGWQIPLLVALQILFMNLVTDDLPAITLALNPSSSDVMKEKPRKKATILNQKIWGLTVFSGILMALLTLAAFYISFNLFGESIDVARTTALITLIFLEIAQAFNFRSFRFRVLTGSPFANIYLFYASAISLVATMVIIYTPLSKVFETVPVGIMSWMVGIIASLVLILVFDYLKNPKSKIGKFLSDDVLAVGDVKVLVSS